ncbi:MAG: aconitate hydratase AcnA [Betaproteobacteria bacterium]|nr:MAG: aconitate hydratase AcnA [Betaproteobacteria bacterium]
MSQSLHSACQIETDLAAGTPARIYALAELEKRGVGAVSRLPVSLRIVLESLLRNCDGRRVTEDHVVELARWRPEAAREREIPFVVGRLVLQCVAGIPLLGDLTAMRGAMARSGRSPAVVEPKVPVDMVLDHSLSVDYHGTPDALERNMRLEIERNEERFRFVKWATQAYKGIRLIPPGFGILHQVNLEYLAPGILAKDGTYYPDTLVGTDSHTCMIAGLGTVGWGVGGIEAQAAALAQPIVMLTPDVVGVRLRGSLAPGVTATDLVLHVTQVLRQAKVVGKFVEFFGEGVKRLTVPDRATIANMAPEYGATIGYFAIDEVTLDYLRQTGRDENRIAVAEAYLRRQGCFGPAIEGQVAFSQVLELDLGSIVPGVAGPKRPQDRIRLDALKEEFAACLHKPVAEGGYGKEAATAVPAGNAAPAARDGQVVIAAIASCTNTSNPGVMLAAGLVAKKAAARGLKAKPWVKTSLTPGSVVVSRYLEQTGLQESLDALGFAVAGYSCATCVGASGPIDGALEQAINDNDVVACAVLSGNRNFEARIHPSVRAAFLASPPLVVAFALAGRVDIDFATEPVGIDAAGKEVMLRDIWPSPEELEEVSAAARSPQHYRSVYSTDFANANPLWRAIPQAHGEIYPWEADSTYIKEPPFVAEPSLLESSLRDLEAARALAILGDSITTDHISPISNIAASSPAGQYLRSLGVAPKDFNNYGARRMNHEVMVRGGFANVRLRNQMVPGVEGGLTAHQPSGSRMSIYDAAMRYAAEAVPLIVIAGEEYGTGSARDWAAKATRLLGVRAIVASSFERIHRSNLVGMGVLPCQLPAGVTAQSLGLDGTERFDIIGLDGVCTPRASVTLRIERRDGSRAAVPLTLRLDTPAEIDYCRSGGIMPYMLQHVCTSGV